MRILVLGAYGLIGSHVVAHLVAAGHEVVGLGRDVTRAARRWPHVRWIAADLGTLTDVGAWQTVLAEAAPEAVVNCAGALQDGARDRVADVHTTAIRALVTAAPGAGIHRLVQISAVGASRDATTAFMRTKADGDAAVSASDLEWVILRPGLVLSPHAYGGTALLRALAAMPGVLPIALGSSLVQTVDADDVAAAVVRAVEGHIAQRRIYDLVEDEAHALATILRRMRGWLGLAPAAEVHAPRWMIGLVARIADALGWLGWRSPLRSTAIASLEAGVRGDPAPWRAETGRPLAALDATLARLPATVQERWFARAFLLKPAAIAVLAAFWIASGLVTLVAPDAAAHVLTARGVAPSLATAIAIGGALVDVALGLAILWRPAMRRAALGMIAVTFAYLAGGTLLAPDLWADPLGPLVKAIPAALLALVPLAFAEDR